MNAVQEQVIRSKVKESMNTALNEARNRGGKWWDTAAKIANTQGMEQLYAQQVIDAANVGFVTITEGVDAAFNLRLSQIACAGLSTALMGLYHNCLAAIWYYIIRG
jgi:hypothetical protein